MRQCLISRLHMGVESDLRMDGLRGCYFRKQLGARLLRLGRRYEQGAEAEGCFGADLREAVGFDLP